MPVLQAAQDWIKRTSAIALGIWKGSNAGTPLVDPKGNPRNYDTLNAVAPLIMEANTADSRFDLSIDPDALTTYVPVGTAVYVDATNGTPDGTPGDAGDPYDTIANGIAAANTLLPSASNRVAVVVRPGTHSAPLSGTITVPPWVKLMSDAGPEMTIIEAADPTVPLVALKANSSLEGFTLTGADEAGGFGCRMAEAGSADIARCVISDCETGLSGSGAGALLIGTDLRLVRVPGQEMAVGAEAVNGATILVRSVLGIATSSSRIGTLIRSDGAGSVAGFVGLVSEYADVGVEASSGGFVTGQMGSVRSPLTGIHIASSNGAVALSGFSVRDSATWDINIEGAASQLLTVASLFEGRRYVAAGSLWNGSWVNDDPDERSLNIFGRLRVGSHAAPATSSFGEGDAHTDGMVAYRYDGVSAWTDVTEQLISGSGSEVSVFAGTAAGNILYIGSDDPFPGLRLITTQAMSGGAVAVEIYTGSWTALPWMSSLAVDPYTTAGQTIFASTGDRNLRFGPTTGWVATAVNGTTKYWWRVRITSPIVTIPRLEQARLHTDHMAITETGFSEYFGKARRWRQLELPTNSFEGVGAFAPGDQDLWFGTLGAVGLTNNTFSGTLDEAVGVGVPIPYEIDTSHRLRLRIKQQATSAVVGTVIWRIFTAVAGAGSVLTTTSPGPLGDGTPVVMTTNTPGVTGQEFISEALIDITQIVTSARPTLLIMIQRQGSIDTYSTDITVRPGGFELDWLTWADGRPYAA